MKFPIFLIALIILSLFIEGIFLSFPIFFLVSFLLLSQKRNTGIFLTILICGLFLDIIRVNKIGITPFFIFASYFIVMIYEKYFGSHDIIIVFLLAVGSTLLYSYFLQYSLITAGMVFGIVALGFMTFQFIASKRYT